MKALDCIIRIFNEIVFDSKEELIFLLIKKLSIFSNPFANMSALDLMA
jgi:hypothetical protein